MYSCPKEKRLASFLRPLLPNKRRNEIFLSKYLATDCKQIREFFIVDTNENDAILAQQLLEQAAIAGTSYSANRYESVQSFSVRANLATAIDLTG